MFSSLKADYANSITSAGHLVLLTVAWQIDSPPAWVACLGLVAAISFFAWASDLKRNRAIADTPTSRIGSAAQGYAEIYGRACNGSEYLASGMPGSLPCVWFSYVTYRKGSDNKWQEVERGVSDSVFALDDGSGRCMVNPENAEVITTHTRTWYQGDYKQVERQLLPSDSIYVLGEFATVGGANADLSQNEDVMALLAEWKKNRGELLQRFDLNQDGQIDQQEWELARKAAQREVAQQHREIRLQPGVHVMRAPQDGRHFLIANLSPQQLKRKYVLWGWFHLVVFFAAGGSAAWLGVSTGALW